MVFRSKKLHVIALGISLASLGLTTNTHCFGNGISNFEGMQCVAAVADTNVDVTSCADDDLPACATPDWFPAGPVGSLIGGVDQMTSYKLDASTRYNQANYSAGSYINWEHDWYSKIDTPYGPALPSGGHLWNEYNGSTLVKSVSCDRYGTFSYP